MRTSDVVRLVVVSTLLASLMSTPVGVGAAPDAAPVEPRECIVPFDHDDGFPYLPTVGSLIAVMIFVDYPDAPGHAPTKEVFAELAPTAEAWFAENSYGQLDVEIIPVHGWERMSSASGDYQLTRDDNAAFDTWRKHAQEAVDRVADRHDFSDVDIVYPVSSNGAVHDFSPAHSAWPGDGLEVDGREIRFFSSLGGNIYEDGMATGPFVIVHETGHLLGEPDHYAYDDGDNHRFVGAWDIMGSMFEGRHVSGWTKTRLGWVQGQQSRCLTGSFDERITLSPMTGGGDPTVVKIPTGTHTGYVLEARHPERFDKTACFGGLLIAHVNDQVPSGEGPLRLEQARPSDPDRRGECGPLYNAPFVTGDVFEADDVELRVEVLDIAADGAVTVQVAGELPVAESPCDGRLSGANRFDTAAKIAAACVGPTDVVYVATGSDFPDALAGGVLAAMDGAAVLLVQGDAIPEETKAQLRLLRPRRIVVLGGPAAVSEHVRTALEAFTDDGIQRLSGSDRFETAVAISRSKFDPSSDDALSVFVATGENFPDALAAVPPATVHGGPILLTSQNSLPGSTAEELARLAPTNIYVLGGPGAVSDAVVGELDQYAARVTRVSGLSRYETAVRAGALVGEQEGPTVFVATGQNYPDALAGGAVAGALPGPILLVTRDAVPPLVLETIDELRPARLVVLGGPGAVSEQVEEELRARMDR